MADLGSLLVPAMAAATAMAVFSAVIFPLRRRARARAADLKVAAVALQDHLTALEKFLDDPAAPLHAKAVLLTFSEIVADKEASMRALCAIYGPGQLEAGPEVAKEAERLRKELRNLRSHRE